MRWPSKSRRFNVIEASTAEIATACRSGALTARGLANACLERIEDWSGSQFSAGSLSKADRLDTALAAPEPVGPLCSTSLVIRQAKCRPRPVLFGYAPAGFLRHFQVQTGRRHFSRQGYARRADGVAVRRDQQRLPARAIGGSSSGSAAAASVGLAAVHQERFASIRRHGTASQVSGRPMGPSAAAAFTPAGPRSTVRPGRWFVDLAKLLDAMAGFDPDASLTGHGAGRSPSSYAAELDDATPAGARIGVLHEPTTPAPHRRIREDRCRVRPCAG